MTMPADDQAFERIRSLCAPATMTSSERIYALWRMVRHLVERGVEGDFVECGVWRGGSVMVMAETLADAGVTDRTLWLYDTFEGMPPPSAEDRDLSGNGADNLLAAEARTEESAIWAYAPRTVVEDNLRRTRYPYDRFRLVQGKVEDTIPAAIPEQIALLRLDTDWYSSTKWELEHLYPRLAVGGVLILDDYGHWQGARQAVDEYFAALGHAVQLHTIDYTGRLVVKTQA